MKAVSGGKGNKSDRQKSGNRNQAEKIGTRRAVKGKRLDVSTYGNSDNLAEK